ncbi:MAG: hypothetical protein PHE96_04900 [Methylococcales bacterium]|nr:hypothetical protein [Methylococcales bacterium]
MNNDDPWTPEEITRANERKRERENEAVERKNSSQIEAIDSGSWSISTWLIVFAIALAVASSFGTRVENKFHQDHLYVIVAWQAFIGSLIIRTFAAIFKWKSALGFLGKVIVMAILCIILFGLTLCSMTLTGTLRWWI